jgi:hypothetical protein
MNDAITNRLTRVANFSSMTPEKGTADYSVQLKRQEYMLIGICGMITAVCILLFAGLASLGRLLDGNIGDAIGGDIGLAPALFACAGAVLHGCRHSLLGIRLAIERSGGYGDYIDPDSLFIRAMTPHDSDLVLQALIAIAGAILYGVLTWHQVTSLR